MANAFANGLGIKVSGASGDNWLEEAFERLSFHPDEVILPDYGADPHITVQKK